VTDPTPWIAAEAGLEVKKVAPAATRNRDAIAEVLAAFLPETGTVLEIASGSGEHIAHLATRWPHLTWQPSDPDADARRSIDAWSADVASGNIQPALALDVLAATWPVDYVDAILCINMVHIAPWEATMGLMRGASGWLANGDVLYLYGPFSETGVELAPSNAAFDDSLKTRNAEWGLRDVADVTRVAREQGFDLEKRIAMPANNLSLIFRKR
jgi:Protein of unknown function (DUF938)